MEKVPFSATVFDPRNAIWKGKDNNRGKVTVRLCGNTEQCPLLKAKQCIMNQFLGGRCPYGTWTHEFGPTKRARSFIPFITEAKEKYKDILNAATEYPAKKMARIGDYVYLPYAHANMNESAPFLTKGNLFNTGSDFIKWENFTPENIRSIISYRPHALMGGEITSYQKEEIPKFVLHLEEVFPDLYEEFFKAYPEYKERFQYGNKKNHVGRTALLTTTVPPFDIVTGTGKKHSDPEHWHWDGKVLISNDFKPLLFDWKNFEGIQTIVTPTSNTTVKITDNSQVDENTVFVD